MVPGGSMSDKALIVNSLRHHLEKLVYECIETGVLFKDAMEQVEMEYIMQVLAKHNYNISRAARDLEINRNTLSKKIEKFQQFERFRQHKQIHTSR